MSLHHHAGYPTAAEKKRIIREQGSFYYKRMIREQKEELRQERRKQRKQARLVMLDKKLASLADYEDSASLKKKAGLQKKHRKVELGRVGLRLERADRVQEQLDAVSQELTETEQAIRNEKLFGDGDPKAINRLQKKQKKQQKRVRILKDRIRTLRQTHFFTIVRRRSLVGFSFVFPWVVGFFGLFLYPLLQTFRLSVGEITDIHNYTIEFIGFEHFSRLLFVETDVLLTLLDVIKNTCINMVMITVFSFYISMLLNRRIHGRGFFRVVCFLPVMLGSGFIMQQLLSQNITESSMQAAVDFILPQEMITYIGPKISGAVVFFLNQLTVILWKSGVQILIFLSGLQSIQPTLYEAARVDGATEWENLWFITLPMMTPMILLNIVFTIMDSFNDSSNELIAQINNYAFKLGQQAYAAAISVFFLLFALLLVGLVFLIMRPFTREVKS